MYDIGCEPSLDPPEDDSVFEVAGHCACCGEPIYSGNPYYDLFEEMVCEACVDQARRYA